MRSAGSPGGRTTRWRCGAFCGWDWTRHPPDHSTISRTRRLIDVETHREVFTWVLGVLAAKGLLKGQTLGVDATTLEANAALRTIVRRDTGEGYQEFLQAAGAGVGDQDPDARTVGAAGSEARAQGIE